MAWDVYLHQDALSQINGLSLGLQAEVYAGLNRLAEDPVKLAKYPVVPFAWKGAVHSFSVRDHDGKRHVITAFFYFDDDRSKTTIYIREFSVVTPFYGSNPGPAERRSISADGDGQRHDGDGEVIEIPAEPASLSAAKKPRKPDAK